MNGTSFSVTAPRRLTPPKRTMAVRAARMMPRTKLTVFWPSKEGSKATNTVLMAEVMLPTWTALPMPKAARAAKIQKMTDSHFQFLPRPFLM